MARQVSEAITLRTYPLRESDLIVSFFARDLGKLRGVARGAKKPKSPFGASLQRLSVSRLDYSARENRELVTLVGAELLASPLDAGVDYGASLAMDLMAELSEQLLPPEEPNERFFRLLLAVLDHLRDAPAANVWSAVTYFSLWAVRLSGFLGEARLEEESRDIAEEMLVKPVAQLTAREWTRETAADLRRYLVRQVEDHIEKKLLTVPLLDTI